MESSNTNQFNIYDIFYFLKRNYIKIIILTFVSVSIGALLILKTKPLYSSHAEIEIEEGDGALTSNWFEGFSEDRKLEDKVATLKSNCSAAKTTFKSNCCLIAAICCGGQLGCKGTYVFPANKHAMIAT